VECISGPALSLSLSLFPFRSRRDEASPASECASRQTPLHKLDLEKERERERESLYVTPTAHGVAQGLDSAVRVIVHGRLHACIKSATHESTSDVSRGAYDESKRRIHQRHGQRRQEINCRASALPERCNWTESCSPFQFEVKLNLERERERGGAGGVGVIRKKI